MLKRLTCLMILIVFALNLIFPILSIATDETVTVTIKFEDENLYNAIIERIEDKIESKNESNYEINIKQSDLEKITYLSLRDKNIVDIKGLSSFEYITVLNLHGNKIEDISDLSQMESLVTLDLTQNKITDISPLSNLTNIRTLYLGHNGFSSGGGSTSNGGSIDSSNTISDLQPLKLLTNIEVLEIAGIGVKDISVLQNLVNLKVLDATSNDIEDITSLSKLNNLYYLSIHGNENIKDFQSISNLTGLTRLSLGRMGISDITFLRNLTNLKSLNLSFNDIIDITPLSNMLNLTTLSIGNNSNLEDISPLAQCTKLRTLYIPYDNISNIDSLKNLENLSISISGNKIDNLNVIDEGTLNFSSSYCFIFDLNGSSGWSMEKHPQFLDIVTNEKEIALPNIFIQAQNENSKMYTEQEFKLVNCVLNESKNKVILNDNIKEATVTIQGGKISATKLTIKYEDNIPPDLEVTYSNKEMTKETVTATITANEKIQQVEGWTLNDENNTLSKVYAKNTEETITVYDLVGNEAKVNISINNIDTTAPQAEINYSTTKLTNKNVTVTVTADEKIKEVEGWSLSDDKKVLTKEFESNQKENITIYDLVGNDRKLTINVSNIDKTPPTAEISYSTSKLTNGNIEVTIAANEEIQEVDGWIMSLDRKKLVKEYENNIDKEKITISDLAGNSTEKEITITNIDKIPPELEITYSTIEETNGTVIVKIKANEKVKKVEGWTLNEEQNILTKDFNSNTTEEIIVYDLAGNGTIQEININNINNIKDLTIAPTILPKTGENFIIIFMSIFMTMLISMIMYKKYKNYKDIK